MVLHTIERRNASFALLPSHALSPLFVEVFALSKGNPSLFASLTEIVHRTLGQPTLSHHEIPSLRRGLSTRLQDRVVAVLGDTPVACSVRQDLSSTVYTQTGIIEMIFNRLSQPSVVSSSDLTRSRDLRDDIRSVGILSIDGLVDRTALLMLVEDLTERTSQSPQGTDYHLASYLRPDYYLTGIPLLDTVLERCRNRINKWTYEDVAELLAQYAPKSGITPKQLLSLV